MSNKNKLIRSEKKPAFFFAGLVAVTAYFNTRANDPFNTPKLLILMILAGWIFGHLVNSYKKYAIKKSSIDFIIFCTAIFFLFSLLVSLLNTDVLLVGLIGDTQRRNGFVSYLMLTIVLLYLSRHINYGNALTIFKTGIYVGLGLGIYGVFQIFGKDFVEWNNPNNSMIATTGNPNFASSLLALLVLISIFSIFIDNLPRIHKIFALFAIVIDVFAIINSQSRQGLLVIFFGLLFATVLLFKYTFKKYVKTILVSASGLGLFAILGMLQIGPLTDLLYKESVSVRGHYWRAAVRMFELSPFTGVGLDRYGAYFKEVREVSYPLKYGFDITSTNAHNTFLQMFATGGVFVGLSYLAIILLVYYSGLKLIKNSIGNEQKIAIMLISGWIGFQAQSLISIDNLAISIWGWTLSGSVLGLLNSKSPDLIIRNALGNKPQISINLFQPLISAIVLVPILFFSILLYRTETDTYLARALADPNFPQNSSQVLKYANNVFDNPLSDPQYKFQISLSLVDMGLLKESYDQVIKLYESDPRSLEFLRWLALYEVEQNNFKKAIDYRNKIAELDPWNANNYLDLGVLYKTIGDEKNSTKMLERIKQFAQNTSVYDLAVSKLE